MEDEQIRNQIAQAVQEARNRAYARAMEGGADDMDEMDEMYGGRYAKKDDFTDGAVRKFFNPKVVKRFAEVGDQYQRGQTQDAYREWKKEHKGQHVKPNLKSYGWNKKRTSPNYNRSPIEFNDKYRNYRVKVLADNQWWSLVTYRNDPKTGQPKPTYRHVHRKPISAAKKVLTLLTRKAGNHDFTLAIRPDLNQPVIRNDALYAQVVAAAKRGEPLLIALFESTQGVRKTRKGKTAHTQSDKTAGFFVYQYWIKREAIAPTSYGIKDLNGEPVLNKAGQPVVVTRSAKNTAIRNYSKDLSYESALASHKVKSKKALAKYMNNKNFNTFRTTRRARNA